MANTPIYENPNGRRRRAARGSTHFRDYVKSSKDDMEKLVPSLKYNTIEQAANVTGRNVTAPWADGSNFRSGIGEGRTAVDYGYNKKEIQEFIQETARVAKENYGLNNINVNTVYGLDDSLGGLEGGFTWNDYDVNNNHIDIYTDTIWKNTALDESGNLLEGGVEKFKERIKYTIGHEMRHQWQHTTEEGKVIEDLDNEYKQTKINDYTDDYDKYYHEPVEVDARYNGEKFRRAYELKAKKYKEKLEKQGFNDELKKRIEEINLRPKNRIIGHQFEKEPINIDSYRKFDNVEPIDWDIDTGNKSPINKHDVSKNTRYKNAKLNKGQKSLRPTITMDGNNVEIDSIYNHSVPKKIIKPIEPDIDNAINVPNNTTVNNNIKNSTKRVRGKKKGQSTGRGGKKKVVGDTGRINKNAIKSGPRKAPAIRQRVAKGKSSSLKAIGRNGKILNNIPRVKVPLSKKDIIKTAANLIVNEAATNTANTIIENVDEIAPKNIVKSPELKIKNETIEKLNKTKQMYEDILTDWTSASGDFNRQINTRTVGPHNIYVEGKQYLDDIEDLKNNYNVDDYVDGSYTMEQEVFKYSEGKGIDGKDVLKIEGDLVDAPNAYASDLNKTLEEAKKTMSPEDYQRYKNNFDVEGALVKTDTGGVKLNRKKVVRNKAGLLDDIGKPGAIMTGLNILGAVGDYKDARRKGHGVISSAARAGVQFAVGEALGLWAIPVMAAKEVPGLVMKGAETLYKENRRMNSAANFQTFGDVQFQDTQQLATMRQSGMEMAKMSQYNLQQTLMGNEATYLHR